VSGTLDKKIREEKRREEKRRMVMKFQNAELSPVSTTKYAGEGDFGCYYEPLEPPYLIKDPVKGTTCKRYDFTTWICGRIDHLVYIGVLLDWEPVYMYVWDTRQDLTMTRGQHIHTHPNNRGFFCMNDPLAVRYNTSWDTFSLGRWEYQFVGGGDDTPELRLIASRIGPDNTVQGMTMNAFSFGKVYFRIFTFDETTGILTASTKNCMMEFDLTELERARVGLLESWITVDEIRRHILSFLVLEPCWASI
jgi:hypothetical protein